MAKKKLILVLGVVAAAVAVAATFLPQLVTHVSLSGRTSLDLTATGWWLEAVDPEAPGTKRPGQGSLNGLAPVVAALLLLLGGLRGARGPVVAGTAFLGGYLLTLGLQAFNSNGTTPGLGFWLAVGAFLIGFAACLASYAGSEQAQGQTVEPEVPMIDTKGGDMPF
ncbi:hypothetical protein SAMN05421504_106227 [Amycolatopsis xylanica]|uniref:Tryptophan-associated transmembrane protein (Trp_oprn_chp) n=1 Tax=Amycolatopsis xylanica TaxID=589385 RepID=A0A1H3LIE5_9PSEU|nr:hypothetical protein [Amycolatopsis xylanica]SDY64096.1 hypothetical protein SAMN05421504_106227 [Amycolatopsis xylanica]